MNIDNFTLGFIAAMLWAETDDKNEPLDTNYSIDDIAPEALQAIVDDCRQFQEENQEALGQFPEYHNGYSGEELAGHDYLLTRNGHGAGYWNRDYLSQNVKDALTIAAVQAGPITPYIGDDKHIHI
jgi:hypothetical protein